MALNNMGLGFMFTARDLASGAFDRLRQKFEDLEAAAGGGGERIKKAFAQVGVGLATMTVGIVGLASGFALANVAGEFEQAVAAVGAVANASAADLKLLRDAAIQAGIATQFSPTEAANGLQELAASGFNARESAQLLIPTLDLAAGSLGKLGVAEAAGLASQAIKAFGLDATKASVTVDQMIQATNAFALSADELPLALGIAARGAGAAKQSFEDTLVAVGLVKDVVPGVERSATAVAVAMEKMVDPKTQRALGGLGIAVTDNRGRFRSLLDVLGEMAPALDKMTDKKRAEFLLKTFGREALGGVQAILGQMSTGIRGANGEMLRGAAALKFLRDQMKNAGGTAAKFRDQMLDTFAGQKTLLAGSMQTLAILLGEPFAAVFKPIVKSVVSGINRLIEVVQKIPPDLKKSAATAIVATAAFIGLAGAAIVAKAGFRLVGIAARAMARSVISAFIPLTPFIIGATLAVGGLYAAFRKDGEGLGAFLTRAWSKARLAFDALVQVFRDGGFSGAVMAELNQAENGGLKRFVIWVRMAGDRVEKFLDGLGEGFRTVWKGFVSPAIDGLSEAFTELRQAVGELGERTGGAFGEMLKSFGDFMPAGQNAKSVGELVGGALAGIVGAAIHVAKWIVQAATAVVKASTEIQIAIGAVKETFGEFGGGARKLFAEDLPGAVDAFVRSVRAMVQPVTDFFTKLAGQILGSLLRLQDSMIGIARRLPSWARSDFLDKYAAQETTAEREQRIRVTAARNDDLVRQGQRVRMTLESAFGAMPAATQAEISASAASLQANPFDGGNVVALLGDLVQGVRELRDASKTTVVQVDGETIARAAADGARKSATRAFVESGPMTVPSI